MNSKTVVKDDKKENNGAKPNKMREIMIEKVTVNIGVGNSGEALDNAEELLKRITGKKPLRTKAKKRNPTFGLRKHMPIGVKVTLRNEDAIQFLKKALKAVKYELKKSSFDTRGNFAFGIKSYIDFPDARYDPDIGMYGFDVVVTVFRRGYNISRRKIAKAKVGKNHLIKKEEALEFVKDAFEVNLV